MGCYNLVQERELVYMDEGASFITLIADIVIAILFSWKARYDSKNFKKARTESKKVIINSLIVSDYSRYETLGKLPRNQERISYEFDSYVRDGGNSWVRADVSEYFRWVDKICGNRACENIVDDIEKDNLKKGKRRW